jgi:hypothetical protein
VADGINLGGGPRVAHLLDVARTARVSSGHDPSSFIVTVSSDLRGATLRRLGELEVDRIVVFIGPPFADQARQLARIRS